MPPNCSASSASAWPKSDRSRMQPAAGGRPSGGTGQLTPTATSRCVPDHGSLSRTCWSPLDPGPHVPGARRVVLRGRPLGRRPRVAHRRLRLVGRVEVVVRRQEAVHHRCQGRHPVRRDREVVVRGDPDQVLGGRSADRQGDPPRRERPQRIPPAMHRPGRPPSASSIPVTGKISRAAGRRRPPRPPADNSRPPGRPAPTGSRRARGSPPTSTAAARPVMDPPRESAPLCKQTAVPSSTTVHVRPSAERLAFAGFRFPPEMITVAVRWYVRYGLS